jgi:excisionase family DNA binding protein
MKSDTSRYQQTPSHNRAFFRYKHLVPLWTPADTANYLGVHLKTAIKRARLGQIPAIRLGKHWRFRASDLTSWVATQVQSNRQPVE